MHFCFYSLANRSKTAMQHMISVVTASLSKQNGISASTFVDFGSY